MPRRSTACRVVLSTGHEQIEPDLDAAKGAARMLLLDHPPGTRARVERDDIETRHYQVDDAGIPRRAAPPPHAGGRPRFSAAKRPSVLVTIDESTRAALDGIAAADGVSRGVVIDRLVGDEARRRAG